MDHRVAAAVGPDPELAAELTALGRAEVGARRWRQAADRLMAAADLSGTPEERAARLVLAVGAMLAGGELARALRAEADLRAGPPTPGLDGVLGQLEAMTGRFDTARETLTAALHTADGDRRTRGRRRPPRAGVAGRGRRRAPRPSWRRRR